MKNGLDVTKKRALQRLLEKLSEGIVIVEGKHDVNTLKRLGIRAVEFSNFMGANIGTRLFMSSRPFYVMMDRDNGGEDKKEKVISVLSSMENPVDYDTETGDRFLRILGITSVEQAYRPVVQVMSYTE